MLFDCFEYYIAKVSYQKNNITKHKDYKCNDRLNCVAKWILEMKIKKERQQQTSIYSMEISHYTIRRIANRLLAVYIGSDQCNWMFSVWGAKKHLKHETDKTNALTFSRQNNEYYFECLFAHTFRINRKTNQFCRCFPNIKWIIECKHISS